MHAYREIAAYFKQSFVPDIIRPESKRINAIRSESKLYQLLGLGYVNVLLVTGFLANDVGSGFMLLTLASLAYFILVLLLLLVYTASDRRIPESFAEYYFKLYKHVAFINDCKARNYMQHDGINQSLFHCGLLARQKARPSCHLGFTGELEGVNYDICDLEIGLVDPQLAIETTEWLQRGAVWGTLISLKVPHRFKGILLAVSQQIPGLEALRDEQLLPYTVDHGLGVGKEVSLYYSSEAAVQAVKASPYYPAIKKLLKGDLPVAIGCYANRVVIFIADEFYLTLFEQEKSYKNYDVFCKTYRHYDRNIDIAQLFCQ
ncbi:hypothetical protein [Spartinivicinus ruber]|uniref:hypothetical protein n=1 Tax=Spartinivicinus ruber TaxID=2683272 RepID=UPI0013D63669|nr:hypothetical protein [Spartinivicinus ruber]